MAAEQHSSANQALADNTASRPALRTGLGLGELLGIALAGAGVLLGVQSVLMAVFAHESLWKTSWVVGAVFMGTEVLHWPAVFDLAPITAALTALYPTALACALVLGAATHRLGLKWAILAGGVAGGLFYFGDLYGMTRLFPWLAAERNWMAVVSHLVFGGATAWLLQRAWGARL
jgi:hypothetical protein